MCIRVIDNVQQFYLKISITLSYIIIYISVARPITSLIHHTYTQQYKITQYNRIYTHPIIMIQKIANQQQQPQDIYPQSPIIQHKHTETMQLNSKYQLSSAQGQIKSQSVSTPLKIQKQKVVNEFNKEKMQSSRSFAKEQKSNTSKIEKNGQVRTKDAQYYVPVPITYPKRIIQKLYNNRLSNNSKISKQLVPINTSQKNIDQITTNMSGNSREVGNSPKAQNSNEENSSGVGKSSDYYSFQKAIINIKNSRNIHTRSPIPFTPANSNTASQIPKADNSKVILANTYGQKISDKFRKTFSVSKPSSYASIVDIKNSSNNNEVNKNINRGVSVSTANNVNNYNHNVEKNRIISFSKINTNLNAVKKNYTFNNNNQGVNYSKKIQSPRGNVSKIMNNTATAGFTRTAVNFHQGPKQLTNIYGGHRNNPSYNHLANTPVSNPKKQRSPFTPVHNPMTPVHASMNKTAFNFRPPTNSYMRQCNNQAEDHKNYLSKYQIIKELGKGTYGVVYLARKKQRRQKDRDKSKQKNADDSMQDSLLFAYGSLRKQRLMQANRGSSIILQPYNQQNNQMENNSVDLKLAKKIKSKSISRSIQVQHQQKLSVEVQASIQQGVRKNEYVNPERSIQDTVSIYRQVQQNQIDVQNIETQPDNGNKKTLQQKQRQLVQTNNTNYLQGNQSTSTNALGTNISKKIVQPGQHKQQESKQQDEEREQYQIKNKKKARSKQLMKSIEFNSLQKITEQKQKQLELMEQMQKHPQNLIAIKIYQKFKMNKDPTKFKNIRKQINIMQNIEHPNIIKLYQSVQTLTKINIVVEYGGPVSLLDYLKQHYPLSQAKQRMIGRQLISAIMYLHEKNIVHRDIKLQNILMLNGQTIKIIDFGFGTLTYKNRKLNAICGTPNYMAPEILSKKQYIGEYADIWSYGVVMFAVAQGRHPFKAQTYNQLERLVNKGVYQFQKISNPIHQAFLKRILKIKPQDRPQAKQIMTHPWLQMKQNQTIQKVKMDIGNASIANSGNKSIRSKEQ